MRYQNWGEGSSGSYGPERNGLVDILSEEAFNFLSTHVFTKYLWKTFILRLNVGKLMKTSSNCSCMKIRLNAHSEMILISTFSSNFREFVTTLSFLFSSSSFRSPCILKGHWSFRELLVFITNDDAILQSRQASRRPRPLPSLYL